MAFHEWKPGQQHGGIHIEWHAMTAETAKAFFTYTTALIVVLGGFAVIYLTRSEVAASELRVIMAGFVGVALQFMFGAQVAQQTASRTMTTSTSTPTTTTTSSTPPASNP